MFIRHRALARLRVSVLKVVPVPGFWSWLLVPGSWSCAGPFSKFFGGPPPPIHGFAGPSRTGPQLPFSRFFFIVFCCVFLRTRAPLKEYSCELGPKNNSKMEPKSDRKGRRPTSTKPAPAWLDRMWTPAVGDPFSLQKPTLEKDLQKSIKKSIK